MARTNVQTFSGDVEVTSNLEVGMANLFVDTTTGNVGIGTTAPAYTLDVSGEVAVPNDGDFVMSGKPLVSTTGLHWDRANSRLGVGTNSPAYTLDVHGSSNVGALTTTTGAFSSNLEVGTANLFVDTQTSNVGIGTTNPSAPLHIVDGTAIDSSSEVLRLQRGIAGVGDITSASRGTIGMYLEDNNAGGGEVARISWAHDGGDSTSEGLGELGFWTSQTGGDADGVPVERMTIRANGNVGIGTTNPSSNLQVNGNVYVSSNLEVGTANLFVDTQTSNVGIGTNSPATKLDVHGTANVGALTTTSVSGDGSALTSLNATNISSGTISKDRLPGTLNNTTIEDASSAFLTIHDSTDDNQAAVIYKTTSFTWKAGIHGQSSVGDFKISKDDFETNDYFVINTNGDVGIGADTPDYKLDVHGTANVGALTTTSVSGDGSGLTSLNAGNITSGTISKDRLPTTLNNTTIGSLAIGADDVTLTAKENYHGLKILKTFDSPNEPATLLLAGDGDPGDDIAFEIRGNETGSGVDTTTTINSDHTTFGILHTGHTYIGYPNLNPGETGGNAQIGDPMLNVSGDIYATGNITAYSDKRAKSDIQKIENALDKIDQLNGYTFTMNDKRYTGVIAQEVLPVLPEAVTGSEETKYAVAYGNMIGLIIEAIKELKEKIG
jgi:hypothetical protein